jgi:thymidylate kinase
LAEYAAEGGFLKKLFSAMSAACIHYAVMRNYEQLPFCSGGSDLDVLVVPAHATLARAVVNEVIRSSGGVPIGISETVGFFKIYALGNNSNWASPEWWGLRLDFNVGLYFRGIRLLDECVAWPIQYHRGIPVLADGFAGVLGVLKEVLNNEMLPDRYASVARKATNEWQQIEKLLSPMGSSALARLRIILLSKVPPASLRGECRKLRQEIISHSYAQQGLRSFWQCARFEWFKVQRYIKPSGVVLAILGVDGSGKSTVINAILPTLNSATHNAVILRHLRPALLPRLARLKGGRNLPVGPVLEPHGSTPSGKLGSLFRLTYLSLDYMAGYWLWTRLKIAKQPTVIIFDRYAYDMALDPRRFRIGVPSRVAGWFASLAPKPDLIICLHGNPEVIAARKRELSVEETRRQVDALCAFASKEPRAVLISTDTSIEETRDRVLGAFFEILQAKRQHNC